MPDNNRSKIGIILIAAGNSSRLGEMKQLIVANGQTLLRNSFNIAEQLSALVITVLGYNHDELAIHLESEKTLFNNKWSEGMGTSIATGVKHFYDNTDGVMIMQCDQYRLDNSNYNKLIESWSRSSKGIIASEYLDTSSYNKTLGAPAIFSKFYYDELLLLREKGAKALLSKYKNDLETIRLDNAAFDLDTKEDLKVFEEYQKPPSIK